MLTNNLLQHPICLSVCVGETHPMTWHALDELAEMYFDAGRFRESKKCVHMVDIHIYIYIHEHTYSYMYTYMYI